MPDGGVGAGKGCDPLIVTHHKHRGEDHGQQTQNQIGNTGSHTGHQIHSDAGQIGDQIFQTGEDAFQQHLQGVDEGRIQKVDLSANQS